MFVINNTGMTTTRREALRFRPKLRATVIALPAFLVLVALGAWQVQRLAWKTELIALIEARLAAPAAPLPAGLLRPGDVSGFEFRRVTVAGTLLHDREIYLVATRRGKFGFHVITPLRRTGGGFVLVDRGWVPAEARDPPRRAAGQIGGAVTIEGLVRAPEEPRWLTPDNDPAKNYWFWRDVPAMAAFAGVDAPPLIVEAGPAANPGGLPIGRAFRFDIPNDHLQYAIIWFLLAAALAVIYVLSQRSPVPENG